MSIDAGFKQEEGIPGKGKGCQDTLLHVALPLLTLDMPTDRPDKQGRAEMRHQSKETQGHQQRQQRLRSKRQHKPLQQTTYAYPRWPICRRLRIPVDMHVGRIVTNIYRQCRQRIKVIDNAHTYIAHIGKDIRRGHHGNEDIDETQH